MMPGMDDATVFTLPGGWDTEEEAMRSVNCHVKTKATGKDGWYVGFGVTVENTDAKVKVKLMEPDSKGNEFWEGTREEFLDTWMCD